MSAVDLEELPLDDSDLVAIEPVPKALDTTRRLGRYVLSHEIASGGMATVHLARVEGDAAEETLFAIKSIHAHLAKDPAFVQMFADEARLAARIEHPNVCRVFDHGQADGTHFLVMEYVVGETLAALHQRAFAVADAADRPRLARFAAHLLADACEGLHAAHELKDEHDKPLGIVHRDISPHNLFVCYDGTVRLIDFGVAKAEGRAQHTKTGVLKGKVAYMPPEQLRRRPLDRRADLWSMGVVLWELVTGKRLFRRDTDIESILAIDQETPPRVSELVPTVPKALDPIVERALAKDPAQRYPTARELADDLRRFAAEGGPIAAAEIAEWMKSIFGASRDRRLEAVDEARGGTMSLKLEPIAARAVAPPLDTPATISGVTLAAAVLAPLPPPRPPPPAPRARLVTPPITPTHEPRSLTSSSHFVLEPEAGDRSPMIANPAPPAEDAGEQSTAMKLGIAVGVLATVLGLGLIVRQLYTGMGPRVTLVPSTPAATLDAATTPDAGPADAP